MKLLIDGTPLSYGGGVQVAIALLQNLCSASTCDWRAILPAHMEDQLPLSIITSGNIEFVEKNSRIAKIKLTWILRRIERTYSPDIVFTIFGPAYFRARSKHVVGFALPSLIYRDSEPLSYRSITHRILDFTRLTIFRGADHLVVETEDAKQRLANLLGWKDGRITVIRNSLNPILKQHKVCERDHSSRPFSPLGSVILVPSTYYQHKNLEAIPNVADELRKITKEPFVFFLTLDPQSPPWKAIAEHARGLGVDNMVRTLGPLSLDQLAEQYLQCFCVMLLTRQEVSTAVYPEAFYFKRPLITSDIAFARELCGTAAQFVDPDQHWAAARAIYGIFEDANLYNEFVTRGTQQLAHMYPTPPEKYQQQIYLLQKLAV